MNEQVDKLISSYLKELAGFQLTLICDTERVKCFRIGANGTCIMSTYITFTPGGICLQGDFVPEHNGSCSCVGYGLKWFAGELSGDYLCGKFLEKKFVRERAKEELAVIGKESGVDVSEIVDLIEDHDTEWMVNELNFLGIEIEDHIPGWGYDIRESAALIAIQRKFRELYHRL